jgi:ATP-dependent Lon protease
LPTLLTEPTLKAESAQKVEELQVLPIREGVLFPKSLLPLSIRRPEYVSLILQLGEGHPLAILAQRDPRQDQPGPSDLHEIGTVGLIHRIHFFKDYILAVCEGIARLRVLEFTSTEPL